MERFNLMVELRSIAADVRDDHVNDRLVKAIDRELKSPPNLVQWPFAKDLQPILERELTQNAVGGGAWGYGPARVAGHDFCPVGDFCCGC